MANTPEIQLIEVVEMLIELYARQAAILKLIRYQNVAGSGKIDETLLEAETRIRNLPVVQEVLVKKRLPLPGSLSRSLTGFPWDV